MNGQELAIGQNKMRVADKLHEFFPHGCKRILFVQPPNVPKEDFVLQSAYDKQYPVYPPEGLAILATDLRARGYETDLIDLNFLIQCEAETKKNEFEYDVWKKLLSERVEMFKPDCVTLTCMFTIYHRNLKRISEFIKENWPTLTIAAGGVHTSSAVIKDKNTKKIIRSLIFEDCPCIDIVCLFEGNDSFGDMIDIVNNKMETNRLTQIMVVINELIIIDERAQKTQRAMDLIPNYHDLPIGEYSKHGRIGVFNWLWPPGTRAATVLTNVGCRAQCSFCSVRTFNGKGVFSRSINSVVDELQMLKEYYDINWVMLLDDDPTHTTERAIALFNEMVKRNLNMFWDASNGMIASTLTEELVAAAAESGCKGLSIGIESGNPEILRSVKKPSGVKHFYRCAEIFKKHPQICTKGLLMCGFMGETIGQMRDTVKLAVECGFDRYTIQPLNLIPGVDITEKALEEGIIDEKSLIDGTERPYVGSTGEEIRNRLAEKTQAHDFINLLTDGDTDRVPSREEIKDIWFIMDYMVNFPKLWYENNPIKLQIFKKLFRYQCDRAHREHALWTLFFAVVQYKFGNIKEAKRRIKLSRQYADNSQYWRKRFAALGLYEILSEMEKDITFIERFPHLFSLREITIDQFERQIV